MKSKYDDEAIIQVSVAMCDLETRAWTQTYGAITACTEEITCKLEFVVNKGNSHVVS
jgi:hypothetical protein